MGFLKSLCTSSYRSSIETMALHWLVFEKIAFLQFGDRQTNRQTDEQMDRPVACCRERWLNDQWLKWWKNCTSAWTPNGKLLAPEQFLKWNWGVRTAFPACVQWRFNNCKQLNNFGDYCCNRCLKHDKGVQMWQPIASMVQMSTPCLKGCL